jgi:GTP-binding protein
VKIEAEFVTSAAGASGFPADGLAEIVLVGRSNVGKSSLINALARKRIARTSAAPGKTRLANVYRFGRGNNRPFYVVDLPGYGYARGGDEAAREFAGLTHAYFGRRAEGRVGQVGRAKLVGREGQVGIVPDPPAPPAGAGEVGALLLVDARHPGLANDRVAWAWLRDMLDRSAIVVTKIDKLARGQRIRALKEFESVFEDSVLPVSAVTGEGLDDLWNLIDTLAASSRYPQPRRSPNNRPPPRATAPRHPKK